MKKSILAIIAMFLSLLMIVEAAPLYAIAEGLISDEAVESEQYPLIEDNAEESKAYIVGEDTSKREENTKIFRMSDGSYTAAVYPMQIHYEEDGEMKEIDNTLQSTDDGFVTKSGPVTVGLPESFGDDSSVEYTNGEHSVSFMLDTEKKAKGTRISKEKKKDRLKELEEIIALERLDDEAFEKAYGKKKHQSEFYGYDEKSAIEEHTSLTMTNDKLGSQITYRSVFEDVDLKYTVSGTTLKEDIILNSEAGILNKYEFVIKTETLSPVLCEDGTVQLCDGDGKAVFEINAPYMYDAAGEKSYDISVKLNENKDGSYTYTLNPDNNWLKNESRVYPIVIDPPIAVGDINKVKDTTVTCLDTIPACLTDDIYQLKVGLRYVEPDGTCGLVRSFIYSSLPSILNTGTTKLVNARMTLVGAGGEFTDGINVTAYPIMSDWNTANIEENNVLNGDFYFNADTKNPVDYVNITGNNIGTLWTWDITEIAQKWLDGTKTNYGLALDALYSNDLSDGYVRFYDSTLDSPATCPQFVYTYRDLSGVEDYWSFTSMTAGRFGSIGVNNYNGNPVMTQSLVSSTGNNMPVSLSLIYSYNSQDNGKCGFANWRTNYHMSIETCDLENKIGDTVISTYKYVFIDSDGTRHYLLEDGSKHRDEDGLGLTLTVINETDYKYQIETKDKTVYKFDYAGRLNRIIDSNGNFNHIYFTNATERKIDRIVEGSDMSGTRRTTTIAYNEWNNTITTPEGQQVIVSFTYTTKDCIFGFFYEDSDGATREGATRFEFDSTGFPTVIYDGYDHQTTLTSTVENGPKRVATMSWGTETSNLQTYTFEYNHNATKITDIDDRAATYQFNSYGQTVCVVDHTTSWGQNYEYGAQNGTNKGYENKLLLASKAIAPIVNLESAGNFVSASSVSSYSVYPSATGYTLSHNASMYNSGSGSMKITKGTSATADSFVMKKITDIEPGNYTLSFYINTSGAKLSGQGAYAQISVYNSSGYRTGNKSRFLTHTYADNWVRLQTTVTIIDGDTSVDIGVGFNADTFGTVYIDDLQFEANVVGGSSSDNLSGAGSFNMLNYTKFDKIAGWYNTSFDVPGKNEIILESPKSEINTAYVVESSDDEYHALAQTVSVAGGAKGDVFVAGGWTSVRAPSLDNDMYKTRVPLVGIYITFLMNNAQVGTSQQIECNTSTEEWQYLLTKVIAPGAYDQVRYSFIFAYTPGAAVIKKPFLYRETYGQSFTYDENGNVVSSTDHAETMAKFAYQDSALTSSISPIGSQYIYTRDESTDNVRNSYSNAGQKVEFLYNESGDATNMTIVDMPIKTSIGETEAVAGYIVNAKTGRSLGVYSIANNQDVFVGNNYRESRWQWNIYPQSGGIYTVRMRGDTSLGLTSVVNGETVGHKLGTISSDYSTVAAANKFKFVSNGDGTFRILTGQSSYVKCLRMSESTYEDGYYRLNADYEYDSEDLANKWYIFTLGSNSKLTSSATYSADGNYLTSSTDQAGNTVTYQYDENGMLTKTTDPKGNETLYTYDNMRRTTGISSVLNSVTTNSVSYTYEKDNLTEINVNNGEVIYKTTYTSWGQPSKITVGNENSSTLLALNYYNSKTNNLSLTQYGNSDRVYYYYDSLDRLQKISYHDTKESVYYYYDPNGNLYKIQDELSDTQSISEFDLAGRVVGSTLTDYTGKEILAYANISYHDKKGTVEGENVAIYDDSNSLYRTTAYEYTYGDISEGENPAALYKMTAGGRAFTYEYDGLGRLVKKSLSLDTNLSETYTYTSNGNNTTTLVATHKDMYGITHTYIYDANGNITKEMYGNITRTYHYDSQNRLIRYDDSGLSSTYVYNYDSRGNIQRIAKYAYTAQANDVTTSALEIKRYTYGDSVWADRLTNINGTAIAYEGGNPLYWTDGRALTWENVKSLASITDGTNTTTYTYNGDGLRTYKSTTGGKTTEYYILDGTYVGEKTTVNGNTYIISYVYDENGAPAGLNINGSAYYFVKNIQGDILAIMSYSGTVMARYYYDAWGNIVYVIDANGNKITDEENVALLNPFRYRGYMYDQETGFYYVSSRYYDPEIGRWISPEPNVYAGAFDSGSGLIGYNVYAYCANNPVNYYDPTGEFVISTLLICVAAGAIIGGTIGGIAGNAYANRKGYTGWDKTKSILTGIGIGGLAGGALGYFAAPAVVSATGVAGISITSGGISTIAALGTSFGKLGTLIANNGQQIIDWGKTTWHGMQRMIERGVTQNMVEVWAKTGKALQQAGDKILYITKQGAVVIDKAGKVITAYTSQYFDPAMQEVVEKLFGK